MSLPKIDSPRYSLYLKGIDKQIKFRPFTVKEQKILLLAKEEVKEDKNRIIEAIKQIIELCTFDLGVSVDDLPLFDIEWLFLHIRAKAVSDVITIPVKYKFDSGNEKRTKLNISVSDIQLKEYEEHTNKIVLDEDTKIGVVMKYPTIKMYEENLESLSSIEACIDYVFDENDIYYFKDSTHEERQDFVESFDLQMLRKVSSFFETMPKLYFKTEVTMKDDPDEQGNQEIKKLPIVLSGLNDFFTYV